MSGIQTTTIAILFLLLLLLVIGMNLQNIRLPRFFIAKEGFETTIQPLPSSNEISSMVRAVLDPMIDDRLCSMFQEIRSKLIQAESSNPTKPDPDAVKRVDGILSAAIPGGPISCPILPYPSSSASPSEWLDFVSSLPKTFGAKTFFMSAFIYKTLRDKANELKSVLSEGFEVKAICPPDIRASRRAAAKEEAASCVLPEEIPSDKIQETIQEQLLQIQASSQRAIQSSIQQMGPLPGSTVKELLDASIPYQSSIQSIRTKAETGTLSFPTVS
jgi:hypothetical protein